LQVIATPRAGVGINHRVLVLFSGDATAPTDWSPGSLERRAAAEPHLDAWAAKLLGNPSHVQCRVEFRDAAGASLVPPVTAVVKLSDLALSALDVLYAARPGEAGAPSELEQLMATKLLAKLPPKVPASTRLLFDLGRDPAWSKETLSFAELFELTRKARDLVTGARAIGPADLTVPEDRSPSGFDAAELQKRADAAATAFKEKLDALAKVDLAKAALSAIRNAVLPFFYFGVPGAIPALPTGDATADRAALAAQVPFVL